MKLLDIIAISGVITSLISAFISIRSVKIRLKVEKELKKELYEQLLVRKSMLINIEKAKNKEDIKSEVSQHIKDYEDLISRAITSMSQEKKIKIYPAISQESEKGKISYISKLLSGFAKKDIRSDLNL